MAIKKYTANDKNLALDIKKTEAGFDILFEQQLVTISHTYYDQDIKTLFFQANGVPRSARIMKSYHNQLSLIVLNNNADVFQIQDAESVSHILPAVSPPSHTLGDVTILKSPLAGRVSQLFVVEGQTVRQDQQLLLIESMKMENEICAPCATFIKTIFIAPGSVVQPNQPLIEFGKEGEDDASTQNEHGQKTISDR